METGTPTATIIQERVQATKRWNWPERDATIDALEREIAREANVSALLARLLRQRGVKDPVAIRAFLDPALTHLHDPNLLPDMDKAVERLGRAIEGKEPVLLYSDYDVDGNTGAAVLYDILSHLGANVQVHVPDRVKDGYGLKVDRLRRAGAEGVKVVISIDNGVTAIDEARFCREVGIDLIVTDHHTMKSELPSALAVIHPRVPGSKYPNPHICGAGVAFKLAWAIAQSRGLPGANGVKRPAPAIRERLLAALGLVALGTVADVVSLEGENRAMVRYGLRALELGPTAGIRALVGIAETDRSTLDATHIAFQLAPRLNAAGRMGDAARAFKLLTARTDQEAQLLASELDRENTKRRGVQKETTEAARIECERVYQGVTPAALVVAGEGWPLGVVGIVAAKLVEDHRRPVLCLTIDGDKAKGSGRSIPGFDLLRALERCKDFLETYGGHAAACGLVIKRERIEAFREAWTRSASDELAGTSTDGTAAGNASLVSKLDIDLEVELPDVTQALIHELALLEPHGQGNRAPILGARGLVLVGEPRPMGRSGGHCSFFVKHKNHTLRVVAFSKPELLDLLRAQAMGAPVRQQFEMAFRPKLNKWNGSVSVELEFEDIRFPAA